jgi:hypothetical protein
MTYSTAYLETKRALGLPVDDEPLGISEQLPEGIPYGQWLDRESKRMGVSRDSVRASLRNGRYPGIEVYKKGHHIKLITKDAEFVPYVRPKIERFKIKRKIGRPTMTGLSSAALGHAEYMRQWRALRKSKQS